MLEEPLAPKPVKRQTLAEQMASTVKDLILSNKLQSGTSLPIEQDLAKQFGVSRAVVRDATRILMAWGLVEVKHGRGVFVTASQNEAFGEALLLALRRTGATVWDVEQFEQIIFPEVVALAAQTATDEEFAHIRRLADKCITVFSQHQTKWWKKDNVPETELEIVRAAYQKVRGAIFEATHNQVFQQLAHPLLRLRNMRNWRDSEGDTLDEVIKREADILNALVDALTTRDERQARAIVSQFMQLPSEAIEAMRQTPVGEIPKIPIAQVTKDSS